MHIKSLKQHLVEAMFTYNFTLHMWPISTLYDYGSGMGRTLDTSFTYGT